MKKILRWLLSIIILLQKYRGKPKIHQLRIINTCELYYNFILKYFWPKKGTQLVEEKNELEDNQT